MTLSEHNPSSGARPSSMASWDYRVTVREVDGTHVYEIREIYYDADDKIVNWSAEPVTPYGGDDASELQEDLQAMLDAFRRGVLRYDDLPFGGVLVPTDKGSHGEVPDVR